MNEITLVFFILSGTLKVFLEYFDIYLWIDFTLLTFFILVILAAKSYFSHGFEFNSIFKLPVFFITVFFLLNFVSLAYSSSENYAYVKLLQLTTIIVAFFFPLFISNFSVEKFNKVFIIISLMITVIYFPLFYTAQESIIFSYNEFKESKLYSIHGSYLAIGYTIGVALIINLFSNFFEKHYRITISVLLFFSLIATGARGPIIAFIIVVLLYFLYYKKIFKLSNIFAAFTIIFASYMFLEFSDYHNGTNIIERSLDRLSALKELESDAASNERLVHISFVLSKIDSLRHLLFGYGFGSYGFEISGYDERSYPHNIILEILFESGLAALFIFFLFIAILIKKLFNLKSFLLWALFIFFILNSLKSMSFTDSRMMFCFFGLVFTYKNTQYKFNKKSRIP